MKQLASVHPQCPHCQSIGRSWELIRRLSPFSRPSLALTSASSTASRIGLIASQAATFACSCTACSTFFRSFPCIFPCEHAILIGLKCSLWVSRWFLIDLLYHLDTLRSRFPASFLPCPATLSEGYIILCSRELTCFPVFDYSRRYRTPRKSTLRILSCVLRLIIRR